MNFPRVYGCGGFLGWLLEGGKGVANVGSCQTHLTKQSLDGVAMHSHAIGGLALIAAGGLQGI
jgi:hypothetical protein